MDFHQGIIVEERNILHHDDTLVECYTMQDYSRTKKRKAGGLTAEHKRLRVKFCTWLKNKNLAFFDKLLVTDSKYFALDGGYNPQNSRYWRINANEMPVHELEKYPSKIHLYGGISSNACTNLIKVGGMYSNRIDHAFHHFLMYVQHPMTFALH